MGTTRDAQRLIGGSVPPVHGHVWAQGATGERGVARSRERPYGRRVLLLHDRRLPGGSARIDQLAIAPSGVWVIGAGHHVGRVTIERPLLGPERLWIGGRDRSELIDRLHRQVTVVRHLLAGIDPEIDIHGALSFLTADLPVLRRLSFRGYPLIPRKRLAKRLSEAGPLDRERAALLADELAEALPPA